MNTSITKQQSYNEACTYDDCLISSFFKSVLSKIKSTKTAFEYTVSKEVKNIKNELAILNTNNITEMSYDYISALEKNLPGVGSRYVVVYKNEHPVLLVYFQLLSITTRNFNQDTHKGLTKGIIRFFLNLKKAKVLVSGNGLRNDTCCFLYNPQILSKEQATEGILACAEAIAAEECPTAVILRDITASPSLAERGYTMPLEDKVMTMDIAPHWFTLQDYINDLTRKYKARANKALEAGKHLKATLLTEAQVKQYEPEMNRIFRELINQQSFVLAETGDTYFSALKHLYKDAFEVIAFFHEDKLLAFYTAFVTGNAYEIYYVGLDYNSNNEYQLYFNILFSGLERSLILKKQQLKLGRTSFDTKASLGAHPENLNYFIKFSHIPDFVLQKFVNYFSALEDNRWKQRNPLKTVVTPSNSLESE